MEKSSAEVPSLNGGANLVEEQVSELFFELSEVFVQIDAPADGTKKLAKTLSKNEV